MTTTPCFIGYVDTYGQTQLAYCHTFGEVEHTGRDLLNEFNTSAKVQRLVESGNMRWVRRRFETPDGQSRCYIPFECPISANHISQCQHINVKTYYVWDTHNGWRVAHTENGDYTLRKLKL